MKPSLMYKPGLFVYDTIISFNLECRAVWTHKITRATALYLALRYVTLGNVITCLLEFILPSCEVSLRTLPNYSSS